MISYLTALCTFWRRRGTYAVRQSTSAVRQSDGERAIAYLVVRDDILYSEWVLTSSDPATGLWRAGRL